MKLTVVSWPLGLTQAPKAAVVELKVSPCSLTTVGAMGAGETTRASPQG